jgi:VCBS repeat protein
MMRFRALVAGVSMALILAVTAPAGATHDLIMGVFADESFRVPFLPASDTIATDVELIDFDRDGDLDLYVTRGDLAGGPRANVRFNNDGTGTYTSVGGTGSIQADYTDADFGDINGDTRLDGILSVNLGPERVIVWSVTAKGGSTGFKDVTSGGKAAGAMPPNQPRDVTIESQFFDADRDGDLDIMTFNEDPFRVADGAQNRLYFNNGGGRFSDQTATRMPAILDQSSAGAIGDFDADGDSDVIVVNNGPFVYLQNDGTGTFSDQTATHLPAQPSDADSGRDAAVADFDADGDLDVVFAISRAEKGPRLWLNIGAGIFVDASETNLPLATRSAQDVEACDLEGDGDLDIIEGNSGRVLLPPTDHRFEGAQERILVNDGFGHFTDVTADHLPAVTDATFSVACGDINGDGRPDLITANGKGEPMRVYVQGPPSLPLP